MTRFNCIQSLVVFSSLLLLSACGGSSSDGEVIHSESNGDVSTACDITLDEQEMLNLVNQARSSSRSCGSDAMPAVAKLTWSCQLRNAAKLHSKDMAEENFFSHTGSNGLSVGDRATASDYSWNRVGENIAAGQTSTSQVMAGWLNSPGHCINIMSAGFTEFGSALVTATESDHSHYWTQVFARSR
jgi:uncharacterized protein YkwD